MCAPVSQPPSDRMFNPINDVFNTAFCLALHDDVPETEHLKNPTAGERWIVTGPIGDDESGICSNSAFLTQRIQAPRFSSAGHQFDGNDPGKRFNPLWSRTTIEERLWLKNRI